MGVTEWASHLYVCANFQPFCLYSAVMKRSLVQVAARSKAWVCDLLLAGIAVSNPARGAWMSVSCECCVSCQVEVSATGRSLVQRSPTECGVSEYDLGTSIMRRPRPTRDIEARNNKKKNSRH
jgi:hypothetical protein